MNPGYSHVRKRNLWANKSDMGSHLRTGALGEGVVVCAWETTQTWARLQWWPSRGWCTVEDSPSHSAGGKVCTDPLLFVSVCLSVCLSRYFQRPSEALEDHELSCSLSICLPSRIGGKWGSERALLECFTPSSMAVVGLLAPLLSTEAVFPPSRDFKGPPGEGAQGAREGHKDISWFQSQCCCLFVPCCHNFLWLPEKAHRTDGWKMDFSYDSGGSKSQNHFSLGSC